MTRIPVKEGKRKMKRERNEKEKNGDQNLSLHNIISEMNIKQAHAKDEFGCVREREKSDKPLHPANPRS